MRVNARIILAAGLVALTAALAQAKDEEESELRKGIKCQADWVKKLKETRDDKILYLLMCRAGLVVNREGCKARLEMFCKDDAGIDKYLAECKVTLDVEQYLKEQEDKWKEENGAEAVVMDDKYYKYLGTKKDESLIKALRKYMSKIRKDFYEKKFKVEEGVEGRFLIKVFPNRGEYLKTGAPAFSGAYYSRSERALVGYVAEEYRKMNQNWMILTMIKSFFHEGWHQYMGYYVTDSPRWLDEGFAVMHESITINGSDLSGNKFYNRDNAKTVMDMLKANQTIPLKDFIYMDRANFYGNPDLCYPQAWALVHFMVYGGKGYDKYYKRLISKLQDCVELQDALDQTFQDMDWTAFENKFKDYVTNLKIPPKVEKPPKLD